MKYLVADKIIEHICEMSSITPSDLRKRYHRHRGSEVDRSSASKALLTNVLLDIGYKYSDVMSVLGWSSNNSVATGVNKHRRFLRTDAAYKSQYAFLTKTYKNRTQMKLKKLLELNAACKHIGAYPSSIATELALNIARFKPYVEEFEEKRKKLITDYALMDEFHRPVQRQIGQAMLIDFGANSGKVDDLTDELLDSEVEVTVLPCAKSSVKKALGANEVSANDLAVLLGTIVPLDAIEPDTSQNYNA